MSLAAVMAILALAPQQQEKFVSGWLISQRDTQCIMAAIFEGETYISFAQDWRTKRIFIRLNDPDWKSLAKRDGETLRAEFKLYGRHVEYDQWWADEALIVADASSDLFAITAWWDGEKHGDDFWPAWALASSAEVKIDGKVVGRFNMTGTYDASLALATCTTKALKDDRSDPFAE